MFKVRINQSPLPTSSAYASTIIDGGRVQEREKRWSLQSERRTIFFFRWERGAFQESRGDREPSDVLRRRGEGARRQPKLGEEGGEAKKVELAEGEDDGSD